MDAHIYNLNLVEAFPEGLIEAVPVIHHLILGRDRPLRASEIVSYIRRHPFLGMGKFTDKQLCEIVRLLRRQPLPILSDNYNGYWWARTPEELAQFIAKGQNRSKDFLFTLSRMQYCQFPARQMQMEMGL